MNSLQREEELKRLAEMVAAELTYLRNDLKDGSYGHVEAILGYIVTQINAYFERQREAVR